MFSIWHTKHQKNKLHKVFQMPKGLSIFLLYYSTNRTIWTQMLKQKLFFLVLPLSPTFYHLLSPPIMPSHATTPITPLHVASPLQLELWDDFGCSGGELQMGFKCDGLGEPKDGATYWLWGTIPPPPNFFLIFKY